MEQNDRLEKNKDFFQGKELFNTKLLQFREHQCHIYTIHFDEDGYFYSTNKIDCVNDRQ